MLAYMQLLEDYSEPQPSVFYQTPQNEHVYQQKNRLLMEVYGFTDSFSSADAPPELAPPPALPPKQRQLVSSPSPVSSRGAPVTRTSILTGLPRGQVSPCLLPAGPGAGVELATSHAPHGGALSPS